MRITEAVLDVNADRPARLVAMAANALGGLGGRAVAVLGLAFKPGTDDVRESPALAVVEQLLAAGASVRVHDPIAAATARAVLGDGPDYCDDLASAILGVDAVIIVTSWPEYAGLPDLLAGRDPQPVVVDGRRMIPPASVGHYLGIGR
jgi:UDPglucose 6-dehydrogenase/GDP-mannose 6-dehydrogenase